MFVRFADIEVRIKDGDESYLVGQMRVQKDGSVQFDPEGNEWHMSIEELTELAGMCTDFEVFVAMWRRLEKS